MDFSIMEVDKELAKFYAWVMNQKYHFLPNNFSIERIESDSRNAVSFSIVPLPGINYGEIDEQIQRNAEFDRENVYNELDISLSYCNDEILMREFLRKCESYLKMYCEIQDYVKTAKQTPDYATRAFSMDFCHETRGAMALIANELKKIPAQYYKELCDNRLASMEMRLMQIVNVEFFFNGDADNPLFIVRLVYI